MITHRRKRFYIFCFFISQLTFMFLVMVCKYSYSVESNRELQNQFKNDFLVRNSKQYTKEIKNEGKDTISTVKNTTNIWTSTTSINVATLRNVKKSIGTGNAVIAVRNS